ncbi:MAG: glycosyltransferase family 2 protein, partial [Candidatus Geothermarchaeales archaeon]
MVIPTLNEGEAIGHVLDELLAEGYPNVLVVDGYSTDDTVAVTRERGIPVVHQNGNGKGDA